MTAGEKPEIFDTAEQGWRDALAVFARMPILVAAAFVILLAPHLLRLFFLEAPTVGLNRGDLLRALLSNFAIYVLVSAVQAFLLAPVAIAVHRFVLLGEVTQTDAIGFSPRVARFFIFAVLFMLLMSAPGTLASIVAVAIGASSIMVSFILTTMVVVIALQALILFPAIAVDAPGARWRNAMADSWPHVIRIFLIMLVTAIPMIGLGLALPDLILRIDFDRVVPSASGYIVSFLLGVVTALIATFELAAFAAVASRLFAAFANRLNE